MSKAAPAKRVLFVLTSHDQLGDTGKKTGWYLPEVAHPYYVLQAAGIAMDFASPKGGKAPCDPSSVANFAKDAECIKFLADKVAQECVDTTKKAEEIKVESYDAIFWAGGHGPMWDLADENPFHAMGAKIYEKGGVVAAVCHGPAGIANLKLSNGDFLIKGKQVTGFTNAEEEASGLTKTMPFLLQSTMAANGGIFQAGANWGANVQVDQRVITGQNPASATGVGEAIVLALSPVRLQYFDGPGRGQLPRLVLACGGKEFEDVRVQQADWPAIKVDPSSLPGLTLGNMPCLQHGSLVVAQSQAVTNYAADIALDSGKLTAQQRALDNMFLTTHADLQTAMYKCLFGTDETKAAGFVALPDAVAKFCPFLEKMLPDKGFLHGGDRPSVADLAVYDNIQSPFPGLLALKMDLAAYPKMLALCAAVKEYPILKEYLSK
jgi:putative intracellular protease/amidase/glutathione S-transferase